MAKVGGGGRRGRKISPGQRAAFYRTEHRKAVRAVRAAGGTVPKGATTLVRIGRTLYTSGGRPIRKEDEYIRRKIAQGQRVAVLEQVRR